MSTTFHGRLAQSATSSARRHALLFLCVFYLVFGVGVGSRAVVAGGLALAALLTFQFWRSRNLLAGIAVQRLHPPRNMEQELTTVTVKVWNRGRRLIHLLSVADHFGPNGGEWVPFLIAHIANNEGVSYRFARPCSLRRGLFILGPTELLAPDELGLFTARRVLNNCTKIVVCPQIRFSRGMTLVGDGTHRNIGEEVVEYIGRSEQFAGLRTYRSGDPLRLVHWPTTARVGRLHIKEFDRSIVTEVTIIGDLFVTGYAGLGGGTSLEYRLRAMGAIAAEAIRRGHFVRLIAAKIPPEQTALAAGWPHLMQVLEWLAFQSAQGHGNIADVIVAGLRQLHQGASVVLVLSSVNIEPSSLSRVVALLRRHGLQVICVVVEDRSFLKVFTEQTTVFAQAPARETTTSSLREAGAQVIWIAHGEDVLKKLSLGAEGAA